MSAALAGVKVRGERRAKLLHHGHYALKLLAWTVFTALPFLLPNGAVDAYGGMQLLMNARAACRC
jgi:hypothetical protein